MINNMIAHYKQQLNESDIASTYAFLIKFVMKVKASYGDFSQHDFTIGNVSPGYMDFTYFPFYNASLHQQKLRFGIVLNHKQMRFELWLMGQNAAVQKEYWTRLKTTKWNEKRVAMPKYSVLEATILDQPDFSDLEQLVLQIAEKADIAVTEILQTLESC